MHNPASSPVATPAALPVPTPPLPYQPFQQIHTKYDCVTSPLTGPQFSRSSLVSYASEGENPNKAPMSVTVGLLPTTPTSSSVTPHLCGPACFPRMQDSPITGFALPWRFCACLPSCQYITSKLQHYHLTPSSHPLIRRAYCIIYSRSLLPSGRFSFVYTLIILAAILHSRLEAPQGMWPCLLYYCFQPSVLSCA